MVQAGVPAPAFVRSELAHGAPEVSHSHALSDWFRAGTARQGAASKG
jgi:hypothetical protein